MKNLIYTVIMSAAMLTSSGLTTAKADDDRDREQRCENKCEEKKEQCERFKPDNAAFQQCLAKVEQDCKQVCKKDNENEHEHHGRDH